MNLPLELYPHVIENVDTTADLLKLLVVSHAISQEVERVLYCTIQITRDDVVSSMALFSHLAHCQRVACHVRELEISGCTTLAPLLLPDNNAIEDRMDDPEQYWLSINQALCALINLRVLTFSTFLKSSTGRIYMLSPSAVFDNCTFKLEVFRLRSVDGELPRLDLTQVKELDLERDHIVVPRDPLPSLQTLAASPSQFLELGISNTYQIKALKLYHSVYWPINSIFPNVSSLIFQANFPSRVQTFPSLRYLCTLILRIDQIQRDPELTDLLEALTTLRNLEKLCCITIVQCAAGLHTKFFSALDSLQKVIIALWKEDGELWERGGKDPVRVSKACIEDEWKNPRWF